jgi:hypothetical protein
MTLHMNADLCLAGAICLSDDKAAIDADLYNSCEACVTAYPANAITSAALRAPIEPLSARAVTLTPAPSHSVAAWVGVALGSVEREIASRLADAFVDALERRLARVVSQVNESTRQPACAGRWRRHRRCHGTQPEDHHLNNCARNQCRCGRVMAHTSQHRRSFLKVSNS